MEIEEIERAKKRCESVIRRIEQLPLSTAITASCRRTLLKLASSELSFLSSLAADPSPQPLSINIGHIETVVWILRLPYITGVSRVCKPLPLPNGGGVHVDLVCTLGNAPVWIIVSDRNPSYISWSGDRRGSKGLRSRIEHVLAAAQSTTTLKPSSLILFFANGLPSSVYEKLKLEFGAVDFDLGSDFDCEESMEGEWVNVVRVRSYKEAVSVEIKIIDRRDALTFPEHDEVVDQAEVAVLSQNDAFSSLVSSMRLHGGEDFCFINFDTTALVALVSGITNGCAERIVGMPEIELEDKFKGNTVFVIAQARSEIENPVLVKMGALLRGKRGIVCESVLSEFKELVSMYAGTNEKHRAERLLKSLMVVDDNPAERVMGLPTTRNLAMKNKTVFGTGDRWGAPTFTANMGFVRAVAQSGMSLSTIDHSPCALIGD